MRFKKAIFCLLLCSGLAQPARAANEVVANENVVQAALLYNFALYTEWPALQSNQFNICVMASLPVFEALQPFKSKQVRGNQVVINKIQTATEALSCQVLFIGQSQHVVINNLASQIGKAPVLVVAEESSFDPQNVIITLVSRQGRIGFKINNTSAQASALTISSKLLKLAQQVY